MEIQKPKYFDSELERKCTSFNLIPKITFALGLLLFFIGTMIDYNFEDEVSTFLMVLALVIILAYPIYATISYVYFYIYLKKIIDISPTKKKRVISIVFGIIQVIGYLAVIGVEIFFFVQSFRN